MMKSELVRLFRSFGFAGKGIRHLFISEPNARIHLALTALAGALALLLGFSAIEWAILSLTIGLVLAAEAFNTAIEALTDLLHPEPHPQVAIVKDVAAGAVALSALMAVIVALFLYIPKLLALLH